MDEKSEHAKVKSNYKKIMRMKFWMSKTESH